MLIVIHSIHKKKPEALHGIKNTKMLFKNSLPFMVLGSCCNYWITLSSPRLFVIIVHLNLGNLFSPHSVFQVKRFIYWKTKKQKQTQGPFSKLYLPKVSPAQNSNESEVLQRQRTFPLLTGETDNAVSRNIHSGYQNKQNQNHTNV